MPDGTVQVGSLRQMEREHHAVIAGTGRSGTTFLVEFLARCGVPTVPLDADDFDERSRAGRERSVVGSPDTYLLKDPWLHEYLDEIDLDEIAIDILIVPVRNLRSAALSRARQERAAIAEVHPNGGRWETFGTIPGGLTHSLATVDQERLLAVGQARLLEWAIRNEIPLVLPHYPRLVTDGEYLVDALGPWLSKFCDRETAIAAFRATVRPSRWVDDPDSRGTPEERATDLAARLEAETLVVERQRELLADRSAEIARLSTELDALSTHTRALEAHVAAVEADRSRIVDERDELVRRLDDAEERNRSADERLDSLRSSRSFRLGRSLTAPLRLFRRTRRD